LFTTGLEEGGIVQVGDLVTHPFEKGVGVILKAPAHEKGVDYLVYFSCRGYAQWYRKEFLKVLDESR